MSDPFDPDAMQAIVARAKQQIRSRMKALRGGYSSATLRGRSERIVEALLGHESLRGASAVASFWPMEGRGEVDLRGLDAALRERGVRLYYPFMERSSQNSWTTGFRLSESVTELVERGRGFAEPPPTAPAALAGDVSTVVVPALAVDTRGHRIGYGAGYYDATLSDIAPPAVSIAVAYDFQLMSELPNEAHDRAVDFVVTDERTLRATPNLVPRPSP